MPRKPVKQINSSSRIMTSANTASARANPTVSIGSPEGRDDSNTEEMPLLWEKISNKIPHHINKRFDNLEHNLHAVQESQIELLEKVKSMEEQALDQENCLSRLEKVVSNLESKNKALKLKVDDLEGRSSRNNIMIIGIPEKAEGPRPHEFIQDLIPKLFCEDHLKSPVIVDRAHRSLRPLPAAGAAPRPIIARIHFYRDKELILESKRWNTRAIRCSFSGLYTGGEAATSC